MTDTLITLQPDADIESEIQPTVVSNSFNDGYSQDVPQGVFNSPIGTRPRWSNMTYAEANNLIAFLKGLRGYKKFLWTAPEDQQRLYKCPSFTFKWKKGRKCDISATFQEVAG